MTPAELIHHLETVDVSDGQLPKGLVAQIKDVEDFLWTAAGRDGCTTLERRALALADLADVRDATQAFTKRLRLARVALEVTTRAAACRDLAVAAVAHAGVRVDDAERRR